MKSIRRIAILLPALLVLVSACATKGWVRETVDKKGTEIGQRVDTVNQRVDTVDGKVAQQSQQIDGVGSRVNTMETSITEVSEAARGAKEASLAATAKADAATTKADSVDQRVTRLWTNRHNPKPVDTVQILFAFDRADLDDKAQTSLSNLTKDLQGNPNLVVQLIGSTDSRGSREYNYQLSQRRVDAVKRYLVERGVQLSRIQAVGLGPVGDAGAPEPEKRRVTAQLMLEQD